MKESNVRPLLNTTVCEVIMSKNKITGIVIECIEGRKVIMADVVIDCTGNADVAWYADAKCKKISQTEKMALTQVFSVAGVDKEKFLDYASKKKTTYKDWGDSWVQNLHRSCSSPTRLTSPFKHF